MRQFLNRLRPNFIVGYARQSLHLDLVAGFTVAMIAVPQAMAYAAIAGVNPIYGLYTAILPAIIAALFGSSRHLNTGPTNGIALVTIGVLLPVVTRADYVEYVFATAIINWTLATTLTNKSVTRPREGAPKQPLWRVA